jgi:hypothetical protein
MERLSPAPVRSVDDAVAVDAEARRVARELVASRTHGPRPGTN